MPIVGFDFDKIIVERKSKTLGNINVKHNLGIKEVEEEKIPLSKLEQVLRFNFEYTVDYEPKVGNLQLNGHILYLDEPKKIKELMTDWKKNKKIPTEIMEQLLNTILFKCNIKALSLSQDVALPPHIPLPRLEPQKSGKDYIG